MSILASSLLQAVSITLQDVQGVRWPATELVMYLNDGQRELLISRPDQNAVTVSVATVAGARQQIPTDAMSLIDIIGNTSGTQRIMRKIDGAILDAADRDWQSGTQATSFTNYTYDIKDPRTFWVYPPSKATGGSVDMVICKYPTDISATGTTYDTVTGSISVPDMWKTTLQNYVLGRAYAKDVEYGGNATLAASYMGSFDSATGRQLKSVALVSPKS